MTKENLITQLSIFVNNEPGKLATIAEILKEGNVNVKVFNLAESTEFGILRAIVDDPDVAFDKIKSKNIMVIKTDMIAIALESAAGSLFKSASVLGDSGINIEYGYASVCCKFEALFIRVNNPDEAVKVLKNAGIKLLNKSEI